jgi:hypothetical protein
MGLAAWLPCRNRVGRGLPRGGLPSRRSTATQTASEREMDGEGHITLGPGGQRDVEPTFFFVMNCLLYSRLESGNPSNQTCYDEDVNVYLANLLTSFMNPDYHERTRKYLSRYDSDLFEKVRQSSDVRLKYTIYKTNADFLLISIGIFRNADGSKPGSLDALMKDNEEVYVGRAKAYYQFAYSYSQSMFRKATAISEVLEKLSKGFEQYVQILSYMRGEYFNILDRLSTGEVYHLERSLDKVESDRELKELQNQFLDLYSDYAKSKDPALGEKLKELVKKIQKLDETFRFTMDQI